MSYDLKNFTKEINKIDLSLDKLKDIVSDLCDQGFNGNNGEDSLIEVYENNTTVFKSQLDIAWDNALRIYSESDFANILHDVLYAAYSYDQEYYIKCAVNIIDTIDTLHVVVSYLIFEN